MGQVAEVSDTTFEQEVLTADRPVVVDFWAPWCGPCRMIAPIMDELASEHGDRVKFLKMNVDENPEVATRYDVLTIPTVVLFEGGEPKDAVRGARPKRHYESAWSRWLDGARR